MLKKPFFSGRSGASLLEVVIALALSTIVISVSYKLYRYIEISTGREKQKAELQRDIITVSNIIETDIRMAGVGLPGNGVAAFLSDTVSDRLTLFTNENRTSTTLASNVTTGSTKLLVNDSAGFKTGGWVCLEGIGVDTTYWYISHFGYNHSGVDTLSIAPPILSAYSVSGTLVYPAVRIGYLIGNGTGTTPKLLRLRNNLSIDLGAKLDSIDVLPKDKLGNLLTMGSIKNASVLTVVVGGFIGFNNSRVFMADSTEVNIRNGG